MKSMNTSFIAPLYHNVTRYCSSDSSIGFGKQFMHYSNGYCTLVVVLVGVACNILTLLALNTHVNPKPIIYKYICALAFWDLLLLLATALLQAVPNVVYGGSMLATPIVPYYGVLLCVTHFGMIGNVWTIVMLAIVRYRALRYPLQYRNKGRVLRFWRVLLGCALVAALYSWPRFFELRVVRCISRANSSVISYDLLPTALRESFIYGVLHKLLGGMLLYSVLPYVLMISLTLVLSSSLRKSTIVRSTRKADDRSESLDASNRILMMINIKYLSTHLLPSLIDIVELLFSQKEFVSVPWVAVLVAVSNLLVIVNSASNFVVYLSSCRLFRRAVWRVLRGHCGQEQYSLLAVGYQIRVLAAGHANGMVLYCPRVPSAKKAHLEVTLKNGVPRSRSRCAGSIVDLREHHDQCLTQPDRLELPSSAPTSQRPSLTAISEPDTDGHQNAFLSDMDETDHKLLQHKLSQAQQRAHKDDLNEFTCFMANI